MSEIGKLIISLQAETAQFREDMGKVKSDLDDLKGKSGQAGDSMDYSMTKARGGIMLLENATGVRLPRALNSLIAQIPGVGLAFSTMLPIIGVIAAIEVISKLVEKHKELKEAAEKMQQAQVSFGTKSAEVFTSLDDKLLEVGVRADELAGNHFGALNKQLELLDHASLKQLMETFDILAKAADAAFATMKADWYQLGSGSRGAQHALDEFKNKYDSLLAQGKDKEAGDLLKGTKESAQKILEYQQGMKADKWTAAPDVGKQGDYKKFVEASNALKAAGVGWTDKEIDAQNELLGVLNNQGKVVEKVAQLKAAEGKVDRTKANNQALAQSAALEHSVAQGALAHASAEKELAISLAEANEAESNAGNKGDKADPDARAQAAITAAGKEFDAEVAYADKALAIKRKEYEADLKEASGNVEKKKIVEQRWANEQQAHTDAIAKAAEKSYRKDVQALATSVDEKIEIQKRLDEETKKAAQQQNAFETKMAQIGFEKDKQAAEMKLAAHRHAYSEYVKAEQDSEKTRFKLEQQANAKELALIKGEGPKEISERAAINHRAEEQAAQHANNMVKITDDEEKRKLKRVQQAEDRMADAVAKTAIKSIFEGKNMAQAFAKMGEQMLETAAEVVLKSILLGDMEQEKAAAHAAAKQYASVTEHVPYPANVVLAPVAAALTFAAVMGFADGGSVPGYGNTDSVPAMLMPGETVVSKALTQQVKDNVSGGSSKGDTHNHLTYAPHVTAIDRDGVEDMLKKHATTFQRHVNDTFRKASKKAR